MTFFSLISKPKHVSGQSHRNLQAKHFMLCGKTVLVIYSVKEGHTLVAVSRTEDIVILIVMRR